MAEIPPQYRPPEPPHGSAPPLPVRPDTNMAMLAHILGITGFIGPLVIYLIERDRDPFVRAHAAESLNFQITLIIASMAIVLLSLLLMFVFIGFFTIFLIYLIPIIDLIFLVIAAVAASDGKYYRYPLTIRFVS